MKGERLLNVFGQIDDKFIVEAMPKEREQQKRTLYHWIPKVAMVAGICFIVGITMQNVNQTKLETGSVTKDTAMNTTASIESESVQEKETAMIQDDVEINTAQSKEKLSNWGLTLSVKNVTASGLILVCTQSGGEPTGQLQTGTEYRLMVLEDEVWKEVPTVIDNIGFNSLAYLIPLEDSVELEINWEWLYGKLPVGIYRIEKEFIDFKETGKYDTAGYEVEFEITENSVLEKDE